MDSLIIAAKGEYPSIDFNGDSGVFTLSGKSFPENVNEFYAPVFDYLQLYKKSPKEKTVIEFNWLYFNTATFKIIIKLILSVTELKDMNKLVEVVWYCKPDYELMIKKGMEIKEVVGLDFKVVPV
jgi:hypothetical protein